MAWYRERGLVKPIRSPLPSSKSCWTQRPGILSIVESYITKLVSILAGESNRANNNKIDKTGDYKQSPGGTELSWKGTTQEGLEHLINCMPRDYIEGTQTAECG